MKMRKNISGFLILMMLCMQLLLAQHHAVHVIGGSLAASGIETHDDSSTGGSGTSDHDGASGNHICKTCLIAKNLSQTLPPSGLAFLSDDGRDRAPQLAPQVIIARDAAHAYSARAPPSFSV